MEAVRLLKRRPWGIVGAVILLAVILLAILSPIIAPYYFNHIDLNHRMEPPSRDYILGTDNLGRDVFSRFLYGARPYLETGLIAIGTATVLGLLLGFLSASVRGKTDSILRIAIVIPSFLITLVVQAIILFFLARVFGFSQLLNIMTFLVYPELTTVIIGLLLSFVFLPSVYITVRKAFLSAFNAGHISGKEEGKTSFRSLGRGLVLLLSLALVNLGIAVGAAVLIVAPMTYYGFGILPPFPEWGGMLSGTGRTYMLQSPWMWQAPVISIAVTVLGLVLFGLALREIWFPRFPGPLTSPGKSRNLP